MSRLIIACVAVSLVLGCKDREEPEAIPTAVQAPPPQADQPPTASTGPEERDLAELPEEPDVAGERGEERVAAEEPAKPERDLASELQAAVGNPVDCLRDFRPSSSTIVRVNISARVRPSGLIIEPSASGGGLSVNDRRCIEQRLSDVVLAPLDAQASQPVSTYVDLSYQPPAPKEYEVGGPPRKLKDVVEPLPPKKTIAPSGVPIDKAPSDRIEGPKGVPIEGPKGVPVEGPKPRPIDG
jgi:hypothetical protein